MICPNCHSINRENAKYCDECGAELPQKPNPSTVISESLEELRQMPEDLPDGVNDPQVFTLIESELSNPSLFENTSQADGKSDAETSSTPMPKSPSLSADDLPAITEEDFPTLSDDSLPSISPAANGVSEVYPERDSLSDVVQEMFADTAVAAGAGAFSQRESEQTADLTGLETLVDSSYVPPTIPSQSGDTMEMPRIEGDRGPHSKIYSAEMDPKELKRQAKAQKKYEKEQRRQEKRQAQGSNPDAKAASGPVGSGSLSDASGSGPVDYASLKKPSNGRKIGLVVAIVALIAVIIAGITYMLEIWGGKAVPDVVGLTQSQATIRLEDAGFRVRAVDTKSDEPQGIVLMTDPSSGSRAEEGGEIVIHVSTPREVPDIVGKNITEAEALINAEGFDHVSYEDVKSNEAEGLVLSVSPEPGTKATAMTPITVKVAVPYTVPDVTNMMEQEARQALEADSYVVNIVWDYTEGIPEGTAVGTDPAAGTQLTSGSTVNLRIARSRASVLIDATRDFLGNGSQFSISSGDLAGQYEISSIDDVRYSAENTTQFTITVRPYETYYWFGAIPETRYGDPMTITGTITWTNDDTMATIWPDMRWS